jgi:hypothetical protein
MLGVVAANASLTTNAAQFTQSKPESERLPRPAPISGCGSPAFTDQYIFHHVVW